MTDSIRDLGFKRGAALAGLVFAVLGALGLPVGGALASEAGQASGGLIVQGTDRARLQLPLGAEVRPYENLGYRLQLSGSVALVEVEVAPLGSTATFHPRKTRDRGSDPIVRLATALTARETTQYGAVSRILAWVGRNIEYDLDRSQPQEAEAVLERGTGYCTGVAKLTAALLAAVEIEAREVAGYVFTATGNGYHRWVEVHYPDRGWVFSDPAATHHYVAATYVRLASSLIDDSVASDTAILERHDALRVSDLYGYGARRIRARANEARRRTGALQVTVLPSSDASSSDASSTGASSTGASSTVDGYAVLEGTGSKRRRPVVGGTVDFVALGAGDYRLEVVLDDGRRLAGRLSMHDRQLARLTLPRGNTLPRVDPPAEHAGGTSP